MISLVPIERYRSFARSFQAGLTLLEMCLALAIALTLAALAVPATGGWIEERAFRMEIEGLATTVMGAKRDAESSGESRVIRFAGKETSGKKLEETGILYTMGGAFTLERQSRKGIWEDASDSFLRIQAGGVVSPVLFRLKRGEHWIVFRFDPLTGHLDEQEFQF